MLLASRCRRHDWGEEETACRRHPHDDECREEEGEADVARIARHGEVMTLIVTVERGLPLQKKNTLLDLARDPAPQALQARKGLPMRRLASEGREDNVQIRTIGIGRNPLQNAHQSLLRRPGAVDPHGGKGGSWPADEHLRLHGRSVHSYTTWMQVF